MKYAALLLCILLATVFMLPVLAEEPAGTVMTEPAIIHGVTRDVTTEPTTEPTKEHTIEPTKEPTREPVTERTTGAGPEVGWITVISTPSGAVVSLDGKTVGVTPVSGTEVGAGTHTVRITLEGYEPYETSIRVSAGEQASADATLKAKETPTPTPSPTPTRIPIGGGKGWFTIHANVDGATASLGELSSGCTISGGSCSIEVGTTTTPVKTFTVQKPGYTIYTGQVTEWPQEGATVDLYATLNPAPTTGSVQVSSYPTGAVATLDGGNWQYTTATFSPVTAGTNHNVQISMNGYQTYATSVYVTAGQTAYVSTNLVPVNPQPSTGSLRVTTSPAGADIYVDGRYMAASPNVITNLAPGTHSLRMHKAGYDEYLRTFTITAGQRTTVDYSFSPLPSDVGSIEVTSTPAGATLFLDGSYMGLTPSGDYFDITSLVPGTHTITIRLADYQEYMQTVYVRGGQVVTINARLTPVTPGPVPDTTGQITVVSSPPGANLYLDNVFRGITPLTLSDIQQGPHIVTAKLDGYADASQSVTVTGGQVAPVALGLSEAVPTATKKSPATVVPVVLALVLIGMAAGRMRK